MFKQNSKSIFQYINLLGYLLIITFIVIIIFKAVAFGHPWSLSCYVCKKCNSSCILGIDPSQLLLAANLNDSNLYITANNIRIKANDALVVDSNMIIKFKKQDFKLNEALKESLLTKDDIILTNKLRAKDAAKFCIKCKACSKICPFNLPITEVIKELEKNN